MKHRLLIANCDVEWRELYQRFLTELGYDVETSSDGLDCLAKLRHAAPAMLVLDLELPWGGGDGVLAWLREESSAPQIPVLLMGSPAAGPDRGRFKNNGSALSGGCPRCRGHYRSARQDRSGEWTDRKDVRSWPGGAIGAGG